MTEVRAPPAANLPDIGQVAPLDNIIQIPSDGGTPVTVFILLVLTSYLSYIFGKSLFPMKCYGNLTARAKLAKS